MPISRGRHIDWTEDEIAALAEISDADIERAAVTWRSFAPDKASDILDAEADESEPV